MSLQPPLLFAFDIGDLLYVILPLLWVVGQFFASKKDEEEKPNEAEMAERRRRIQEEIRRRIQAQREGNEQGPGNTEQPAQTQARTQTEEPGRPQPGPLAERTHRKTPRYDPYRSEQEQTSRRPEPARAEPQSTASAAPTSSLEERLAEQRRRLAEAEKMREEAFAKASSVARQATSSTRQEDHGSSAPTEWGDQSPMNDQLRSALANPAAARTAIVIGEVLGPPVGLREEIGERLI